MSLPISLPDEVMPGGGTTLVGDCPSRVTIDGEPFKSKPTITTQFPGSDWSYTVYHHPVRSDVAMLAWHHGHDEPQVAKILQVFSTNQSVQGSSMEIHWHGADGVEHVAMLAGMCGREWWDPEFTKSLAQKYSMPAQWESWLFGLVAKSATESNSTKDTGSAVIESWKVVRSLADRYGVSPAVAAYYAAFSRETAERPRFALNGAGEPIGARGQRLDKSTDWWTWTFSPFSGKNPGDEQHNDVDELVDAYELTGCPVFLWHVMVWWLLCRLELPVFQTGKDYADSGSARSPAYAIEVSAHFFRCVRKTPVLALTFGVMALETIRALVTRSREKWRILSPYFYGSPPQIFKDAKEPYLMVFQAAVMAWATQEAYLALHGHGHAADALAEQALAFSDGILRDFLIPWHDPALRTIAYAVNSDDIMISWHTIGPGVDWWVLPAIDRRGLGEHDLAIAIWRSIVTSGQDNPAHKYHPAAVKAAAPRLGYTTEVIDRAFPAQVVPF